MSVFDLITCQIFHRHDVNELQRRIQGCCELKMDGITKREKNLTLIIFGVEAEFLSSTLPISRCVVSPDENECPAL